MLGIRPRAPEENPLSSQSAVARLGRPPDVKDRIVTQIAAGIVTEDYPVGSRLPSMRTLSFELGASRKTIDDALDELEKRGYIDRRPGKGAFVKPRQHTVTTRAVYDIVRGEEQWRGLLAAIRRSGGEPFSTIISAVEVPATEDVARRLRIPPGVTVFERSRIQGAVEEGRQVPIQLSWSYYTMGVVGRVPEIRQDAGRGPTQIRSRIVEAYGPVRYEHTTDGRHATAGEGDRLRLPDMAVVFDSWRACVEEESGILLEVTRMVMDARKVTLSY